MLGNPEAFYDLFQISSYINLQNDDKYHKKCLQIVYNNIKITDIFLISTFTDNNSDKNLIFYVIYYNF